jgi:regulator of sigma D
MIERMRKMGVTPQSAEQPIDYDIPESLFMLAIYLTNPDVDNQRRSIKIKGGIRTALSQGHYPMRAFFGYETQRNSEGKSVIIPHPEQAPIVQHIFDQVLQGVSQKEIRTELARQGITISRNNMSLILKRIIYAGKIVVPAYDDQPMKMVQGIHEPLISEQQFYQVQQLLHSNRKLRGKHVPKYAKLRDDFHLRGVLQCSKCGSTLTSSFSKGKLGKRYGYYHCNSCKKERVSANKVHKAFDELLQSISIQPEELKLYDAILEEQFGASHEENKTEVKKLTAQLDQINERVEKSQDLMLDGKLDPDEYVSIKTRLTTQTLEIKNKIDQLKSTNQEVKTLAQKGLKILTNIAETYAKSSVQLKHKIVGSIFPEFLSFDGKKCRTPRINELLALFSNWKGFTPLRSVIPNGARCNQKPTPPSVEYCHFPWLKPEASFGLFHEKSQPVS